MVRLVKQMFPDFPDDRNVQEVQDPGSWFRIRWTDRTLMIPPEKVLRFNPLQLDAMIEALTSFKSMTFGSPEYSWDDLDLVSYQGDDCLEGIKVILDEARASGEVACDIETRRIEWEDNYLLSIAFATTQNRCIALYDIPIIGTKSDRHNPDVYVALEELFSATDFKWVWHNGQFDCGRLKYLCNLDAHVDDDSLIKHYSQINERKGTHGLKSLGPLYLQAPQWDDELSDVKREWCKKTRVKLADFMYDSLPDNILIPYMQRDAIATLRLIHKFEELARPGSAMIYRKLIEATNVYSQIELNGMQIDFDHMEDLEYDLDLKVADASKRVAHIADLVWRPELYKEQTGAKTAPQVFNPGSPSQLKWMFEQVLGFPVPNTDKTTMAGLLQEVEAGAIQRPLAKDFIVAVGDVRKNTKYLETYVQGIRAVACRDGRVRCSLKLHGTETGRLSSSNPNMQNIPRNAAIKNLIVSKRGYKLLQLDYSQAELRVLAVLSEDPYLAKIYIDGKDLHDSVATDMFGPNFTKEERIMAKTINFGIAYGRGPSSIAENFHRSISESRSIIEKWYKPMPKVKEYINSQRNKASKGGECITVTGRVRHFTLTNENYNHVQNEYINTPIQSLASDLTMFSLLDIHKYIVSTGVDAKIVMTVHDSIILEVIDDDTVIQKVADACMDIMANVPSQYIPDLKVPFRADSDSGYKWGEMHDLDYVEEDTDEVG